MYSPISCFAIFQKPFGLNQAAKIITTARTQTETLLFFIAKNLKSHRQKLTFRHKQ